MSFLVIVAVEIAEIINLEELVRVEKQFIKELRQVYQHFTEI